MKAKVQLEADLATALAAQQASETALAAERQRLVAMDREFKLNKAQLTIARLETEKLKGANKAAESPAVGI